MENSFVLGIDVGKYFFSATLLRSEGPVEWKSRRFDMTRSGFEELARALPESELIIGIEASGRLDDNLMGWLSRWAQKRAIRCRLIRVNPGQCSRFAAAKPRRDHTDESDARHVAEYVRVYASQLADFRDDPQAQAMARCASERLRLVEETTAAKNRIHDQLLICFPEFRQVFQDPFGVMARAVLRQVPTVADARRRRPSSLARTKPSRRSPSLGVDRARQLIGLARNTVAGDLRPSDAQALLHLFDQLELMEKRIQQIEKDLLEYTRQEPVESSSDRKGSSSDDLLSLSRQIELADTLPGIALVSAATLVLCSGGLDRFYAGKALSAQWACCPERDQTGVSRDKTRLTQKGDHKRRAILYLNTRTATIFDAAFAFHKWKAKENGLCPQQAVCACMNRMARVLHAVVVSNRPYNVNHMIEQIQIHHADLWKTFVKLHQDNQQIWKNVDKKWLKAA